MPFNADWDKPLLDAFAALRAKADDLARVLGEENPVVKEMRDAVAQAEAAAESKLTVLRDERDDLKKRLSELKGQGKPSSPSKPTKPSSKGYGFTTNPKAQAPKDSDFETAQAWLERLKAGAMGRVANGLSPYASGDTPFRNFDLRWVEHYTFPLKALARTFGLEWAVKDAATLYLGLLPHAATEYGPGVTSKSALKAEQKGVRRFNFTVEGKPTTSFDNTDLALLELGIGPGTWGSDRLLFADNLHLPEAKAALEELNRFALDFKKRMTAISGVLHPGKPWWWTSHALAHALINFCAFLYSDWLITGDKTSLEGYRHIAAQINGSISYVTGKDGTRYALLPHFITGRNNDIFSRILSGPQGAQDATYCETFIEGAISLYWMGADLIDAEFLAAYGNTMMRCTAPDGFGAPTMAEAICGSLKEGDGSRNGQQVICVDRGAEVIRAPGLSANRTGTRGPSINLKRAGHFAATAFSVAKRPEVATAYHKNLETVQRADSRLGAASMWRLMSRAQPKGYLEVGR